MIDLHCHFLPGIDDGPDSEAGSLDLARAWLNAGVERIVATPHVNLRHPNRARSIAEAQQKMLLALERENLGLKVETGAEVSAGVAIDMPDDELGQLTLGDSDWLLIEPPTSSTPFALHGSIFGIRGRGWNILLAHPERNPAIQEDMDLLVSLVDGGIKTQVTAGSFSGRYGKTAARTVRQMMDKGLVHTVASDAHHAVLRPPEMSAPLTEAGYGAMADWLCQEMPAWILDGGPEPRAPENTKSPKKGLLGRFRNRG
ncbi:MAG: hypothetical protein H6532_01230 [Thermoleophilales bacterium]|nr:hypothetical protein [Thermoleophilales bacterium]